MFIKLIDAGDEVGDLNGGGDFAVFGFSLIERKRAFDAGEFAGRVGKAEMVDAPVKVGMRGIRTYIRQPAQGARRETERVQEIIKDLANICIS